MLCSRLEAAVTALQASGCYLQAIARKYYVAYTTAKYVAIVHGVSAVHARNKGNFQSQDFRHNEMADLVRSLYTGLRRGTVVDVGDCHGITEAKLSDGEAWRIIEVLQADRKLADYGPGTTQEPYSEQQAKERLKKAQTLTEDLRKLL